MFKCEVCGRQADKHHIIYRSQGGVSFPINFKYLCFEHHRGKSGPHKNRKLDLQYKLEMKSKLEMLLIKDFYYIDELVSLLDINKGLMKKLLKNYKLYKEGYKKEDIISKLMGKKFYEEEMLESYSYLIYDL